MTVRLTASLRATPATVPALAALALLVVWATDQAGYPITHWAPGGLFVLALLCIALGLVGLAASEIPIAVRVALCALAAYTALSYLSILWAGVPGDAWEGANRTLLYLLVFALFACWRQRGETAALLVCLWTIAMIALAAFAALHLRVAGASSLHSMLPGGRLAYPTGYPNANAAQWLMPFWSAVMLARTPRIPWGARGLLAGGAVLLAEVALLSQSRGSLFATPAMLVLVFALVPERTRTFLLLAPVALGVAAAAPTVLDVGDRLHRGVVAPAAVDRATAAMFAAGAVVGLVVAAAAAVEAGHAFSAGSLRRMRLGARAIATVTLALLVVGALVAAGNPVARIESAWHSFKGGYGASSGGANRLVSGLGSNRYDFYRVALDQFRAHPVAGIGADNFQQQYLAHGRSEETPRYPHSVELRTLAQTGVLGALLPRYPHSVELRTLAQTGVLGALLALVGVGAALLAAAGPLRDGRDPLVRCVTAAALAGFAYWVVHGSFDWFWEFAGLGAPAFALLGIACSLAPARATGSREPAEPVAGPRRALAIAAVAVAATAAALTLAAPWLSQLEVQSAARVWPRAPLTAYSRLQDAARLNPLSDEPYLVAGSIALRYTDLPRADREFRRALARTPADAYATLERGAIASAQGRRADAAALLGRAVALSPREPLAREALRVVREGRRIDVQQLNRLILLKARQLA